MPDFEELLKDFDPQSIEAHHGAIVGLWPDWRMALFNPAWFAFARANDGEPAISRDWPLGRSIMEAIPGELQAFYREAFTRCLRERRAWDHDYECSSDKVFRRFHLRAYPLGQGAGLLMVHSLRLEQPHPEGERPARAFEAARHRDRNGIVHQCANCRRIQNLEAPDSRWDWVPFLLNPPPPKVSHTICPICYDFYHA